MSGGQLHRTREHLGFPWNLRTAGSAETTPLTSAQTAVSKNGAKTLIF